MKRIKRHKVKTEAPETSTSHNREQEVHDLAYYIHDRVELMHQVFSVMKYKELKAMVPASIRNISLDDLQELCTEELLGISSKRLCAILDGAEPPSDTESSSPSPPPEQMETISLDSISSDDEILSQSSSNKKKKHKHHRHSKSKSKRKRSSDKDDGQADKNKASRAGLTVLELLELQARARAIRAQLQQEQKPVSETAMKEPAHSSDNEVEIKEEPAEVVEISSDEEKPKVEELQKKITEVQEPAPNQEPTPQTTVTKRINDLVITVPQKTKQKIKLNRNKSVTAATESSSVASTEKVKEPLSVATTGNKKSTPAATAKIVKPAEKKIDDSKNTKKDKSKKKKKDKKNVNNVDIDNDEITLQLSDTEKMDLLEDLDRKHYDSVSSESSSDSSSDSDESDKEEDTDSVLKEKHDATIEKSKDCEENAEKVTKETEMDITEPSKVPKETGKVTREAEKVPKATEKVDREIENVAPVIEKVPSEIENETDAIRQVDETPEKASDGIITEDSTKNTDSKSSDINTEEIMESEDTAQNSINSEITEVNCVTESANVESSENDTVPENADATMKDIPTLATKDTKETKDSDKNLSEGELSDRESSEVEAVDLKPEVVCISDDEGGKKAKKKKKKKEKKAKKEKKLKKKSDFRESADQNFYKDKMEMGNSSQDDIQSQESIDVIENTNQVDTPSNSLTEVIDKVDLTTEETIEEDTATVKQQLPIDKDVKIQTDSPKAISDSDLDAVYEIMELSDDSSCCEVECNTILSKEPTASEIEALSAKIDEIERVDIITDKEIRDYEREKDLQEIENISWKDRYLDSKKVKKVLTTANILNAMRKKNIELKKKLAESKMETEKIVAEENMQEVPEKNMLVEGTIDHYNTLEALTKYVDPVKELHKDLKKDAKLLLKMYKKLLKFNDMNKPDKKHKKKKKKIKKDVNIEEGKDRVENVVNIENKEVNLDIGEELRSKENELVSNEET